MTNTIEEKINNGLLSFDELCDFIVNSDLSFEEKAAIVNYYVVKRLEQLGLDEKILEQIKSKQFEYCHAKSEEELTSFLENKKNNGIIWEETENGILFSFIKGSYKMKY